MSIFGGIFQFPDCFMKKSLVKRIWNANEKARKMKKIFCFDICSCHYLRQNLSTSDLSFSQVTSVEKREPRKHFSASAYGLGFKNFFLGTLFSTSVTWEKLKSDVDKFCLRRGKNKYRNKILLFQHFFPETLSNFPQVRLHYTCRPAERPLTLSFRQAPFLMEILCTGV